jgi:hypothetical protein
MFKVTSERLAIGLVFVVIGMLACLAPTQSDTWWLLRAGRETLQTGSVALADTSSHTASGLFWPNHEWLSEVIFYSLHWAGRLPLVTLFCSAVIVGTWVLSWTLTEGALIHSCSSRRVSCRQPSRGRSARKYFRWRCSC